MTPINHPFRRHALAIALALASGATNAATIYVGGACTLVNAINNANSGTDTDGAGGCPAGGGEDSLNLEPNAIYTLTAVNNTNSHNVPNGLPIVTSVITINGNKATILRSSDVDTPYFRLLEIAPNGNLTLNELTLTGGKLNFDTTDFLRGGGIGNYGSLNIIDSTISANSGWGDGGGLFNRDGSVTLSNSIISDNVAYYGGGSGLYNWGGTITLINSTITNNIAQYRDGGSINNRDGNVALINSTISGNSAADYGAGITNRGGTVTLTNSTISGNTAGWRGGGITNWYGNVALINSTISGNSADHYGGLDNSGSMSFTNSIIANSVGGDCWSDGAINLQGINFISDGSCGAPLTSDAKLRPLLDNGGLTFTHALHGDSPTLAAADKTLCPNTDQRNVKRPPPNKAACDLGAFERKPVISTSVAPLVSFFDRAAASGGLVGVNNFDERIALRNQLLTAGDYKQRNLAIQACSQLARTLGYIDADNSPETGDYVTGTEADALADEIIELWKNWSCR